MFKLTKTGLWKVVSNVLKYGAYIIIIWQGVVEIYNRIEAHDSDKQIDEDAATK